MIGAWALSIVGFGVIEALRDECVDYVECSAAAVFAAGSVVACRSFETLQQRAQAACKLDLLGKPRPQLGECPFELCALLPAVAAYLPEVRREDVLEEPTDKLGAFECHGLFARLLTVVFIAEGDGACVDSEDAPLANGNAMRVACKIAQHLLGPSEGTLGVNLPTLACSSPEHLWKVAPGLFIGELKGALLV